MHIFQIDNVPVTEWTGSDPDPIWDKFLDPNPNKMYLFGSTTLLTSNNTLLVYLIVKHIIILHLGIIY